MLSFNLIAHFRARIEFRLVLTPLDEQIFRADSVHLHNRFANDANRISFQPRELGACLLVLEHSTS